MHCKGEVIKFEGNVISVHSILWYTHCRQSSQEIALGCTNENVIGAVSQ